MNDIATEHERALIAAVIADPQLADPMSVAVMPADFSSRPLGQLFAWLLDAAGANHPIGNDRWLIRQLQDCGLLAAVGHRQLAAISEAIPTAAAHWQYHAGQIRNLATLRRLALIGQQMVDAAADPHADAYELLSRFDAIAQSTRQSNGAKLITLAEAVARAIQASSSASIGHCVPTGISSLDESIGGLYGGELAILAARPSVGKSALAFQIAKHSAERGRGVLFVSLEMSERDLGVRDLAAELGVEVRVIRSGLGDDTPRAEEYAQEISALPLRIGYSRRCAVSQVRSLARLSQSLPGGLALIVVDYLGLLVDPSNNPKKPRWETISEISAALKSLAMELAVPVLACCQLTRDAEGKPPTLAQLRDSGAIEQDADVVLLLHRETRESQEADLHVAKNRNGATGHIGLMFDPATTSFGEPYGEAQDCLHELTEEMVAGRLKTICKHCGQFFGYRSLALGQLPL